MRKMVFLLCVTVVLTSCSGPQEPVVFISPGNRHYHARDCPFCPADARAYSEDVVVAQGYMPCPHCLRVPPPARSSSPVVPLSRSEPLPIIETVASPEIIVPDEFERRLEIAKGIYTRSTPNQIKLAADYICEEGSKYRSGLDRLRAIEMLIDAAPARLALETEGAVKVSATDGTRDRRITAVGRETTSMRIHGLSVRQVAESIVQALYEEYMAPTWAEQQVEMMRVQANRARDLQAVEESRRTREARHQAIAEQTRRTTEYLQRKGAEDQANRAAGHRMRTGY